MHQYIITYWTFTCYLSGVFCGIFKFSYLTSAGNCFPENHWQKTASRVPFLCRGVSANFCWICKNVPQPLALPHYTLPLPPILALCKPPQGMQRGICSVHSHHWGFSSVWEGQRMNEWTGWAAGVDHDRICLLKSNFVFSWRHGSLEP